MFHSNFGKVKTLKWTELKAILLVMVWSKSIWILKNGHQVKEAQLSNNYLQLSLQQL